MLSHFELHRKLTQVQMFIEKKNSSRNASVINLITVKWIFTLLYKLASGFSHEDNGVFLDLVLSCLL